MSWRIIESYYEEVAAELFKAFQETDAGKAGELLKRLEHLPIRDPVTDRLRLARKKAISRLQKVAASETAPVETLGLGSFLHVEYHRRKKESLLDCPDYARSLNACKFMLELKLDAAKSVTC